MNVFIVDNVQSSGPTYVVQRKHILTVMTVNPEELKVGIQYMFCLFSLPFVILKNADCKDTHQCTQHIAQC